MLLQIVRKEILHHLQSLKFSAILITILALFLINGIRFRGEHAELLEKYSQDLIKHGEKLKGQAKMFRVILSLYADKPPNPLSFCVEGGEQFMPGTLLIGINGIDKPGSDEQKSNSTLPMFEEIDWAFIAKMLIGLFAILLTYGAICGEKEQGTLA